MYTMHYRYYTYVLPGTTCILQVLCILPCRHYIHAGTTCTYKYTTGTTGIYYTYYQALQVYYMYYKGIYDRYYWYYTYYQELQVGQVLHTNLPSILTPCDRWTTGIGTGFETSTVHVSELQVNASRWAWHLHTNLIYIGVHEKAHAHYA